MGTKKEFSANTTERGINAEGDADQRLRGIFKPGDEFMVRCKVGGRPIELKARMNEDLQSSPSTLKGKWGIWMTPAVLKPAADNIRDGKVKDAKRRLAGCAEVIRLWREKGEPDAFWIGHQGVASHLVKAANGQPLNEKVFSAFSVKIDGEFVDLRHKAKKAPKSNFGIYEADGRLGIQLPGRKFSAQQKMTHFDLLQRAFYVLNQDISGVYLILERLTRKDSLVEMKGYATSFPQDFAEHKRRAEQVSSQNGAIGTGTSAVFFECEGWSRNQYLSAIELLNAQKVEPQIIRKSIFAQTSNTVLEGVPGTGKTHAITGLDKILETVSKRPVNLTATSIRFMTMHPSTSYEDFVEGLRPAGSTQRNFVVWGEPDKGGKAQPIAAKSTAPGRPKEQWVTFKNDNKFITVNAALENSGWFVQLQPAATQGFTVRDGFFVEACKHAVTNPTTAVVVVLDELNRCNIPKVLGDLMTVIEESKRVHWNGAAWVVDSPTKAVTLPYSGRKLFVPDNLFIVGTMNTTDRSVAPMDAALRRRFAFHRIWPQGFGGTTKANNAERTKLQNRLIKQSVNQNSGVLTDSYNLWLDINEVLFARYGADAMLGHSYLDDLSRALAGEGADATTVVDHHWNHRILPQLMDVIASNGLTRSLVNDPRAFFAKDPKASATTERDSAAVLVFGDKIRISFSGTGSQRMAHLELVTDQRDAKEPKAGVTPEAVGPNDAQSSS